MTEDLILSPSQNVSGDLHQSQWDEFESGNEDEEERHFSMLMDSNVFEESVSMFCLVLHIYD